MSIKRLGKYEILEELGRGGFAVVYKARDPGLNRVVALKVLHPYWSGDPGFAARFQREAQAAAGLFHPHIVSVYEAGEAEGQLYMAMAYLPGRTLRELLEAEGALPLGRAWPILSQIAEALDYAHKRGVVHRDVKPANIMVQDLEGKVHTTLLDFGLVKAMEQSTVLTSQGTLLGSPEYMAPEQADPERAAEIGPAADRYALGIVAYHMLTGRVPFPGNTPSTLNAHEHKPVPPPCSLRPDLPEPVAEAVLNMLAKAPADRYPSAGEFVAELRNAPLYERLQAAAARKDWTEVLEVGGQIRASDPDYRDVSDLMTRARRQLQRPRPIPAPPTVLRQAPRWIWGVGAVGLIVLLALLCLGLGNLIPGLWPGPGPTATEIAELPTATATNIPPTLLADTPAPTSALTPVPPTLTSTPTETARSTDTPTPQPPTPTPAPGPGTTQTRRADGMVMVYVPAGTFQMGSDEVDPNADDDEKPPHEVTLDAFWIDETEVTVAMFRTFVQNTAYDTTAEKEGWGWVYVEDASEWQQVNGASWQHPNGLASVAQDKHPVVQISWDDAAAYCEWAGGRLPTEAEWEYAARGPDGYIYPWGDAFDGQVTNFCDASCPLDWKNENYNDGYERTAPVGSFLAGASWVGTLDMAGNVWEWVYDWYDSDYYASSPAQNPTGPETGDSKVLRGGSWADVGEYIRAASRNDGSLPATRYDTLGFRCVVEPGS